MLTVSSSDSSQFFNISGRSRRFEPTLKYGIAQGSDLYLKFRSALQNLSADPRDSQFRRSKLCCRTFPYTSRTERQVARHERAQAVKPREERKELAEPWNILCSTSLRPAHFTRVGVKDLQRAGSERCPWQYFAYRARTERPSRPPCPLLVY